MVNSKHLATFLLGAAAGAAFLKYNTMSDEEKEEMMEKFKAKAEEFKSQATDAAEKAEGYFEELQDKSMTAMKDMMDNAEEFFDSIMKPKEDGNTEEKPA